MSSVRVCGSAVSRRQGWVLGLVLLLAGPGASPAAETVKGKAGSSGGARAVLGVCNSPPGTLLVRSAPDKAWRALKKGDPVRAGDELLALAGTRAEVDLKSAGLRLTLLGVLPELSPSPALESAVQLRRAGDGLDLTLQRGRALLSNPKKKTAQARVHFLKETWEVSLSEPATEVVLELYGSWRTGVKLPKKADAEAHPDSHFFLLTLKGNAEVRQGSEERALPPLALYHWNTAGGLVGPLPLKELPTFLAPRKKPAAEGKATLAGVEGLRDLLADGKSVAEAIREAIKAPLPATRRAGVYAAAAVGDVGLLLGALGNTRNGDVRTAAVRMLRHWLGHGSGHAPRLYQALLAEGYRPGQADSVLYLLHSFSALDRTRPETYETLIEYLQHSDLRVRELAFWQLYRMAAPAGRSIIYNAGGTPEERAQAQASWRQLLRSGQLPPRLKSTP
jgi:hypothetical protein